jgi:uncharacterized protein
MKPAIKSRMQFEIKEISEAGEFEGVLSPYGNVDSTGDVVEPGSYAKTLKEGGSTRPLLWQHKTDTPIGEIVLDDRKDGLWAKGKLLMELPEAQKAYLLIKARIVKGLSIGFTTIKDTVESGIRHLHEIKLYEGSIVTFPANSLALITSVKGNREAKGDFNEEFEDLQTMNGFWDMQSALNNALYSLVWADLTRDEKVSACETILQQFADAFSAFFPTYIDALAEMFGPVENWSAKKLELKERMMKAGAQFSTANKNKIQTACDKIKGGHDELLALLSEEAGATTSEEKAAKPSGTTEPEVKTEPEENHSAILMEIRSLIPAA